MPLLTNEPIYQSNKPLISYGWMRALLLFAFFFLVLMAVSWTAGELLNLIQKAGTGKDENTLEMMKGNIWFSVAVSSISVWLSVCLFRTFIDRQTMLSLGFVWRGFAGHAWAGLCSAIAMIGGGTLLLMLMKYLTFTSIQVEPVSMAANMALMVLVAFSEELLFRGYILHNLMQSVNKWLALIISALLFTMVHAANPASQDSILPLIEIFIGGLMLGINYIYTKNLWFGIFLHFGWNFFMGPVLGYEVSGINLNPIFTQNITGPQIWTGGAFGFEGSVLSMAANVILMVVLVAVYERKSVANVS